MSVVLELNNLWDHYLCDISFTVMLNCRWRLYYSNYCYLITVNIESNIGEATLHNGSSLQLYEIVLFLMFLIISFILLFNFLLLRLLWQITLNVIKSGKRKSAYGSKLWKRAIYGIKNFLQLNDKKKIIQDKKCENDLNIHFFKENRQISNKHMKWVLNIISY